MLTKVRFLSKNLFYFVKTQSFRGQEEGSSFAEASSFARPMEDRSEDASGRAARPARSRGLPRGRWLMDGSSRFGGGGVRMGWKMFSHTYSPKSAFYAEKSLISDFLT